MLLGFHITNIAVIKKADIEFRSGLNVLTGETGAGKSIIIDSLSAILGGRVSRDLVRHGCDYATVSAVFEPSVQVLAWLSDNDFEAEDELIVSRRISDDGKSRARINGRPATATQLRELGTLLIDIHGQNDGRRLLDEAKHRDFLDAFGSYEAEMADYVAAYKIYSETHRELKSLNMDELEKERKIANLRYSIEELGQAKLQEGEFAELSARCEVLRNSEKLTQYLQGAYGALYGGDVSANVLCSEAKNSASRATRYIPELQSAVEGLASAEALIEDAAETIRDYLIGLDFSEAEYDKFEERLAGLRKLFKKYSRDEAELIAYYAECESQLDALEYSDERKIGLQKKLDADKAELLKSGANLTKCRINAGEMLAQKIENELHELSMPSAKFLVSVTPMKNEFDRHGCDEVAFLMSANRGTDVGKITKIASGGELSRIMLAMKNVFAETDPVMAMVFDEIDTGVSGIAATRVSEKLGKLSKTKQILCVTHLPQIAAMADAHYNIIKTESDGATATDVF